MRYEVTEDWTASYDDPITLAAGEPLVLSGRQDNWEGHLWLWAHNAAGKEGWIPDGLVEEGSGGPVAREAYSAMELSCGRGEGLDGLRVLNGWAWCRNAEGALGWVPLGNLRPL